MRRQTLEEGGCHKVISGRSYVIMRKFGGGAVLQGDWWAELRHHLKAELSTGADLQENFEKKVLQDDWRAELGGDLEAGRRRFRASPTCC